ncbi:MAG: hypothetical protein JNK04_24730, partial [Myxococcales bacterium]|nr:hypothetical protein [Myxococcales bacterium]
DFKHDTVTSFSSAGTTVVEQLTWQAEPESETLWVLPLPPDADVTLSSSALVTTIDQAVAVFVRQPPNDCFVPQQDCFGELDGGASVGAGAGGGVGGAAPYAPPVSWPLEMTPAADAGVVGAWFDDLGVIMPAALTEAVEGAELEGYGFLLVRLPAQEGLQTSAAIRITTAGPRPEAVPMLAPRTDASIELSVIGGRRYTVTGEAVGIIEESELEWSWDFLKSNYDPLAGEAIDAGWLAEAGEPMSPYMFDPLFAFVASDPAGGGYDIAQGDPLGSAHADVDALRLGLDAGSTWITRLSTRVPPSGLPAELGLSPVDSFDRIDRDLTPTKETGTIPSCEPASDACDFEDEVIGDDFEESGCSASGSPLFGTAAAWLLAGLGIGLARRRRLPVR